MTICERFREIKNEIPEHVKIVAVSKTKPNEDIIELYNAGHKIFGENKVQELTEKQQRLPEDIEWHMIGHLQSNKVKYIAPFIDYIHAVDSLKLLKVIDKEARKNERIIPCLFQLYIAKEESKFGLSLEEIEYILNSKEYQDMDNIEIHGLMGMATFTDRNNIIRSEFRYLTESFNNLRDKYFENDEKFREKSIGMSGDYRIALEEGATMIRIGSTIFGERVYS